MSCEAEARKRVIYRVTFVGFVVNLVLTAMKFAAGTPVPTCLPT